MHRFLQKLLFLSFLLLLLSGGYRLILGSSAEKPAQESFPSFQQQPSFSTSCLLKVPFQFTPFSPGPQGESFTAGKLTANPYKLKKELLSWSLLLRLVVEEEPGCKQLLFLLYRKLRL